MTIREVDDNSYPHNCKLKMRRTIQEKLSHTYKPKSSSKKQDGSEDKCSLPPVIDMILQWSDLTQLDYIR